MHSLIWLIILFPPLMAYLLWLGVGHKNTGPSSNVPYGYYGARVRFGRHGYWILLAICYASFFGVALALHKI